MGRGGPGARTSALVFLVLFVHSLPEGFAIGTAFASERDGLGLFVILAIAIQNIPEGTSVAIPMAAAGFSRGRQFWAAVGTSLPQPIGALIAYVLVEEIGALLPLSFAFAAGAMLSLIAVELLPDAYSGRQRAGPSAGVLLGAAVMLALSIALGV
jgi:ZIP family zinc transporter